MGLIDWSTAFARRVGRHAGWRAHRVRLRLDRAWQRSTSFARRLPTFFVIGVMKSGSSALFAYLIAHPAVEGSKKKEVHYFDYHFDRSLAWYRSYFPLEPRFRFRGRRHATLVGEADPDYLFSLEAPARLAAFAPDAKLIIVLRDPVMRALSHYHETCSHNLEPLSFAEAIECEEDRLRGDPRSLPEGFATRVRYPGGARHLYSYVARGRYLEQIERWLEYFPREQLHVIASNDLRAEPGATMDSVFRFLAVPRWRAPSYPVVYARDYEPMEHDVFLKLTRIFEEPNRRLFDFLGRDLGWSRPS